MDQIKVIEDASLVKKSDQISTLMESKETKEMKESKNSIGGPVTPYLNTEKIKLSSLSTPIEDVFDLHNLTVDPNQKNNLGTSTARKLDFGSSEECVSENGSLIDSVYESILESIIAETLALESSHDVVKTPKSVARTMGLAECPGAPMKVKKVKKLRNVDMRVCRKLEFDSLI